MGAACCGSSDLLMEPADNLVIQTGLFSKNQDCKWNPERQGGKQLSLFKKIEIAGQPTKAALLASSVTQMCEQEMRKAWTDLKSEFEAQQLVWRNTPHKASEKAATEELSQDLQAVLKLSASNVSKAGRALAAVLLIHKAVLSTSILEVGQNIQRLIGLTVRRQELSNVLITLSRQSEKSKVPLKSDEIGSIVNAAELTDKRLAEEIEKLLSMIDLDPDDRSVGSASTGLPLHDDHASP
eukprot:TRINITY_DN16433_c1_g1_i1.p1 TRINITY_DN16433_c1_g1~~TRINITY_DN16433_c1_g1_i1.p1  ORF type:complete len:239 (-),score=52.87 TRINITY_DN16433_c1_g1_i1:368-1084(-)